MLLSRRGLIEAVSVDGGNTRVQSMLLVLPLIAGVACICRWPDGVAVWLCEATRKDDAEAGRTEDALKVAVAKALADSNKYPNASAAAPN